MTGNTRTLPFTMEEYTSRLGAVRGEIRRRALAGLVVVSPQNLYRLTGYRIAAYVTLQAGIVPEPGDGLRQELRRLPLAFLEPVQAVALDRGGHPVGADDLFGEASSARGDELPAQPIVATGRSEASTLAGQPAGRDPELGPRKQLEELAEHAGESTHRWAVYRPAGQRVAPELGGLIAMARDDVRLHRLGTALDLLARKLLEDETRIGVEFPYVTDANGKWRTMSASVSAGYRPDGWTHGNWFCGFWVGLLVAAHLWTRDERYLAIAEERMRLVAQRAEDGNTHDIGFIFISSAVPLFHVTGAARHRDIALKAAERLRSRLVVTPRGAYIASWGPMSDPRGRCSSAIDTMANIPLLFWAAEAAGDASFSMAGAAHAEMTRNLVRPDHSTFHAAQYDLATGARVRGYTFQGWRDDSLWARGQAWAIYGYAATAAATGRSAYLDLAEALAERFFERLGSAPVPPYDFDDPDPARPLDSAAAAIVASGLLDLASVHPDPGRGALWRERAVTLLDALLSECLAREDDHRGLLKHGCYSWPHRDGVDSAVLFGDYYFIEAICALLLPGKLRAVRGARLPA